MAKSQTLTALQSTDWVALTDANDISLTIQVFSKESTRVLIQVADAKPDSTLGWGWIIPCNELPETFLTKDLGTGTTVWGRTIRGDASVLVTSIAEETETP